MRFAPDTGKQGISEGLAAAALFFVLYGFWLVYIADPVTPQADALRYIDYVLAINLHGTFGLTGGALDVPPEPGRANAPLYMMLVALAARLDPALQESFRCVFTGGADCALKFNALYITNALLGAATIAVGMAIARRVSGSRVVQWLSGFIMLAFFIKLEEGLLVAPENAMLLPFFVLCWALLRGVERGTVLPFAFVGIGLALTTLIRPSYLYLLYGFLLAFTLLLLVRRDRFWLEAGLATLSGFALAVMPWALRNLIQFGDPALSGGQYAEIIIAQRLAYHALDWSQAGVALLYWLPDFGDRLAQAVGSERTLTLLGTGPGSIYATAIPDLYTATVDRLGGTAGVLRDLIETHVIGEPLKFLGWTGIFAWRGLFVAKLLGLVGLFCTLLCIRHVLKRGEYALFVLLAPMAFMVGFHAAISINIARYNLFLLLPYALCIAWVLVESGRMIAARKRRADG